MKTEKKGALYVVLGVFLFGLGSTVLKLFYKSCPGVRFQDVVQLRMIIASAIFFAISLLKRPESLKITKKDFLYFGIFGMAGVFVVQFFLMYAVSVINVGLATFTQASSTIMLCLYSTIVMKEKMGKFQIAGLVFGMIGLFVIFYTPDLFKGGGFLAAGLLAAVLSAIGKTFYILFGKKGMNTYYRPTMMAYGLLCGSLLALLFANPIKMIESSMTTEKAWILFLILAGPCTVLAFLSYFHGVARLSASTVAVLNIMEPVSGTLTAFLILGEKITMRQGLGCLLIAAGVVILNFEFSKPQKE